MAGAVSAVDPEKGSEAAKIIKAAVRDHVPVLRVSKAAALAGITDVGWHRAIKSGRGYESTFIAMARVTGVEPQVRKVLGLPPLDANVVQLPARAGSESTEDAALRAFRDAIRDDPRLTVPERQVILTWYHSPDGQALLKAKLAEAQLARARQG
jgi:hypothetical protein